MKNRSMPSKPSSMPECALSPQRRPVSRRVAPTTVRTFGHAFALACGVVVVLAGAPQPAIAHGEAKPLHGGIVQVVSDLQFELVVQKGQTALFVVDHGKPADASRMGGKLTALQGAQRSEAPLKPVGGNQLLAAGLQLAPGAKVVAVVQGPDGKPMTVRFTVK